jgi:hypothetical protein
MDIQHPLDADIYQVLTIPIPDPAAAAPISYTCPANCRLEILTLSFTLATDANAANRLVKVMVNDGVTTEPTMVSGFIQVASRTYKHYFGQGYQYTDHLATFSLALQVLPHGLAINSGNVLAVQADNMQAGDTFTDASIRVRRWIQP